MIEKYLRAIYKDGGRGEISEDGRLIFDCWGLVRAARVEFYDRPLMPSYGGEHQRDPLGFTKKYNEQAEKTIQIKFPCPGSIVAVLRKKTGICTHVALVVHDINKSGDGLHVLEINPKQNARLIPLYRFLEQNSHRELKFYDDQSLS
jgi:cell wall-associated NlpC family hydrolase